MSAEKDIAVAREALEVLRQNRIRFQSACGSIGISLVRLEALIAYHEESERNYDAQLDKKLDDLEAAEARIAEIERLNSELTLGQEYMEKWSDRGDFLCYRHEWLAHEARRETLSDALREYSNPENWTIEPAGTAYDSFEWDGGSDPVAFARAALATSEQATEGET